MGPRRSMPSSQRFDSSTKRASASDDGVVGATGGRAQATRKSRIMARRSIAAMLAAIEAHEAADGRRVVGAGQIGQELQGHVDGGGRRGRGGERTVADQRL